MQNGVRVVLKILPYSKQSLKSHKAIEFKKNEIFNLNFRIFKNKILFAHK
jgi:hypothetical protein